MLTWSCSTFAADVCHAAKCWDAAFKNDPLYNYVRGGQGEGYWQSLLKREAMAGVFLSWKRTKLAITMKGGSSVVIIHPPSLPTRTQRDVFLDTFGDSLLEFGRNIGSREARKRDLDSRNKIQKVISETLGERVAEMIHVPLVFTDPSSQGRGYASALLDTVGRMADMLGEACWLGSSNIANEPFYNSNGFYAIGEAIIGGDDPNWHEAPVIVQIMVREPQM
ncbi:hypothetical protein MD484_g5882, partial [Candolleomyces efflorescens]